MKWRINNWRPALGGLALLFALLLPVVVRAHPAEFTTLQVKVEADGRFEASLNIDILSFALGQTSLKTSNEELEALLNGPRAALAARLADADEHFRHEVVVRTDAGTAIIVGWTLPDLATVDAVLACRMCWATRSIYWNSRMATVMMNRFLPGIIPAKCRSRSRFQENGTN